MKIIHKILITTVLFAGLPAISLAGTQTFTSNGTFTVPAGISTVSVDMKGGGGGFGGGGYHDAMAYPTYIGAPGGSGASRSGAFTVSPGQSLSVYVGRGGGAGSYTGVCGASAAGGAGYNPGSNSGAVTCWYHTAYGGGGGGSSAIVSGGAPLLIAPGGGGGGAPPSYVSGVCYGGTSGGSGGGAGAGTGGAGSGAGTCSSSGMTAGGNATAPIANNQGATYNNVGGNGSITFTWVDPVGTINVSSNISSSWIITGPSTITGSGTSQSSPSNPVGTYTIAWGSVSGYVTPSPQSLTLPAGGTITFNGNYVLSNIAPVAPIVSGPTTTAANTTQTYSFVATDPQSDQVRYGVDWNMDGVADVWIPAGVAYVNSGTSQSTTYSWSTAGTKTFQVLAQDAPGLNSAWTTYTVTVTCSNGTNNPPTCTQCPDNQAYQTSNCVTCGNGGCAGPGGSVSNPNGSLTCNNGALTPAYCADCPVGKTLVAGSCINNCSNGATNPPTCDICPVGQTLVLGVCTTPPICDNNDICGSGETTFNCPNDCRIKYQQF